MTLESLLTLLGKEALLWSVDCSSVSVIAQISNERNLFSIRCYFDKLSYVITGSHCK